MKEYDVIIVGAGSSGLLAGILAARGGRSVLIIEQKEKAGKKILATGNGKCNYTNLYQTSECYRSDDNSFVFQVLPNFDTSKTIKFFKDLGIIPKERNGYIYPNSEQASSVVSVLLMECQRLKVEFIYNEKVISVIAPDFTVITAVNKEENIYYARKLILATGGCAAPKLGSDGSGYDLAKLFGHKIIKPLPALVSLKSPDKFCKKISGVRTQARVKAYGNAKLLFIEEGEIIFTDYGISGIPIMQLSRFVSKALDMGKASYLMLDLYFSASREELFEILMKRCKRSPEKTMEEMLVGMFNHKLNYILMTEAKLDPNCPCSKVKDEAILKLTEQIKGFMVQINGTNTFEFAQVTAGGVSTLDVDPLTMESKKKKNLYLIGELLDMDGTCGGYNLQWAWCTGYVAGTSVIGYNS